MTHENVTPSGAVAPIHTYGPNTLLMNPRSASEVIVARCAPKPSQTVSERPQLRPNGVTRYP